MNQFGCYLARHLAIHISISQLRGVIDSQEPHSVMFEQINGALICDTALKTKGGAGPSGIDAAGWRQLVTSFRKESMELCEVVAMVARHMHLLPFCGSSEPCSLYCMLSHTET